MDLALNNAKNIVDYYKSKGETVAVEIVTYGPGLHMLRTDTSPVKDRIAVMSLENPGQVHRLRQHASQSEQGGKQTHHAHQRGENDAFGRGPSHGAAETRLRIHPTIAPARSDREG